MTEDIQAIQRLDQKAVTRPINAAVLGLSWEERRAQEIAGPYIVWTDYGCEGWQPDSYQTLKEALEAPRYGSATIITKPVKFDVVENDAL